MNNNQMNFDPMTGQPINNNPAPSYPVNSIHNVQPIPVPVEPQSTIMQPTNSAYINPQQQMQSIATIEQDKHQFIQNTQANNVVKKEEKKDGPNIGFIITLFVIILGAILFIFPYLMKVLG